MISDIKHIIKNILGIKDYWWYQNKFERIINHKTLNNRKNILNWADNCLKNKESFESEDEYRKSNDPIVRQGYELREKVLREFKNIHKNNINERILIHIPSWKVSPAGYSLFTNMMESLNYIGIPADKFDWDEDIDTALKSFKPTILLSGDHSVYLNKINWDYIDKYRKNSKLKIGLTASLEEYGNTPLLQRLDWAKEHAVDFYYSFREEDYINTRKEYKPFFERNYKIFSIPFGANPLIHYPVPNIEKDIDFVFIASVNKTKAERYLKYMGKIVKKYSGFIDGPNWKNTPDFSFNRERDRYIYSKCKIGLNIHLDEQIYWACETSERTYQLAACGLPQVTDHAMILDKLFPQDSIFIADTARQYNKYAEEIISRSDKAQRFALLAQKTVFDRYTTFHRASRFVTMLSNYLNK